MMALMSSAGKRIDQLLDPVPEMVAEVHPAPDRRAEQDQREIGNEKQRGGHRRILGHSGRRPKVDCRNQMVPAAARLAISSSV